MSLIKVVKSLGGKKNYGVEFSNNANKYTIARILDAKSNDLVGFANMQDGSQKTEIGIDKDKYDVEPMFPISDDGLGIIISGEQGSGKSTMGAMFVMQYEKMYPKRNLFLVSQKSKSIDRNLSNIKNLHQLSDDEINNFNLEGYKNSLFLIDDSDFGKNVKSVMELFNLVSSVGREYNISWIFITHFNSRLNVSKAYSEFKVFITFHNNLNNNRMLMCHMGMNRTKIERLVNMKSSYYMFNRMYDVLITDKVVEKYK